MVTSKEFGRHKAGYNTSNENVKKPKNGSLSLIQGSNVTILANDKPFALIQSIKKRYIANGYKETNLKISYKK